MVSKVYRADGTCEEVTPQGEKWTLPELQAFVGGYIELVNMHNGEILFVNEDGLSKQLPPNERATTVLREVWGPNTVVLVGDVLHTHIKFMNTSD